MNIILADGLVRQIERYGFHPALVCEALHRSWGAEPELPYVVHHDTAFISDQVQQHMTILGMSEGTLWHCHVDEEPGSDSNQLVVLHCDQVPLEQLSGVALRQVLSPSGEIIEAILELSWGSVRRLTLGPGSCPDPGCTADHGLVGETIGMDATVAASTSVDGTHAVARLLEFYAALTAVRPQGGRYGN